MMRLGVIATVAGLLAGPGLISARAERLVLGQTQPVPKPFPSGAPTRPANPPAAPAPSSPGPTPAPKTPPPAQAAPAPPAQPTRTTASEPAPPGTPIYPTAEFIDSYDAGAGQRYYLYGTNASYADILTYYRNLLKNSGRELYRIPPMQQFDLGRFDEETMVYPPSVVVKDYTWNSAPGYLAISGTTEKRFKTVIQIVPVTVAR